MTRMRTRLAAALAATVLVAPFSACSSDGDGVAISADSLEEQLADALEEEVGQRPDSIDCPEDLEGEVGATQRCTLTAGADELGVEVTVTAVDGDDVDFDYVVDETAS